QAVRRDRVGEARVAHAGELVVLLVARPELEDRAVLLVRVEQVADRRFGRLVVRRERAVDQPGGDEEPPLAVRLHDERVASREEIEAYGAGVARIARRLRRGEVGDVVADPLAARRVPPDPALALAPRVAIQIRGGAVVEDAAVRR